MRFISKSKAICQATKISKMLLIGAFLAFNLFICGCGAKERILSTEVVHVGTVRVASSPKGQVYLDGRHIGSSPLNVRLNGIRHKVERITCKPGPNIDDAIIVGIPVTAVFPPAGLLVLLSYGQNEGFVQEERDVFLRDKPVKYSIEVRRPEYKTAHVELESSQLIETWCPRLELTAEAKARIERDLRLAEAARQKAVAEKHRRENIRQVVRVAEETSAEIQRVTTVLSEIEHKSIETQKALLQQNW